MPAKRGRVSSDHSMLSERQYIDSYSGGGFRDAKSCIIILIGVNVAAFVLFSLAGRLALEFALSAEGVTQFKLWQFVSYMFIHANVWHILFNMWGLYLFGTVVLSLLGTARFLTLYFLSGVSGAGLWLLVNWNMRSYLVGASAGVFGVMMAAAMLYPNMKIQLLFPPIPMTMKVFVLIFAGIEVLNELSNTQGGVAHLAHLGGFLCAYVYITYLYGDQVWDMFGFLKVARKKSPAKIKVPKGWKVYSNPSPPREPQPVSKEEVNRILDKISAYGMDSLSEKEFATLQRASKEMKRSPR